MTEHHKTPDDMLRSAQEALRRAKSGGRNLVFSFSTIEEALAKAAAVQGTGVKYPIDLRPH